MKRYLSAFLGGAFLFASCKTPDGTVTPVVTMVAVANVPSLVLASMSHNFPSAAEVTWRQSTPATYVSTFKQGNAARTATFEKNGGLLKAGEVIDPSVLPAAITTYLAANHPGYAIVQADVKKKAAGAVKEYEVLIAVNNVQYELKFDGAGVFKKLETADGHKEENAIAASALPASVTSYLAANYPGYVFKEAETRASNGALVGYQVLIVQNNTEFELNFDAAGTFLSMDSEGKDDDHGKGDDDDGMDSVIVQSALPAVIGTYLSTNYAGYTFVKAEVEKNKAGCGDGLGCVFYAGWQEIRGRVRRGGRVPENGLRWHSA